MADLKFYLPHGFALQYFLAKCINDSYRCFFSLKEIIILIKNYAIRKKLLEPQNRSIILCDKFLSKALGCQLLHHSQLVDIVTSKKTFVKLFRLTPNFHKIIHFVCKLKRKRVFSINEIKILFEYYLRSVLHKIISSDNPQILIFEKETLLFNCFRMKGCHVKQLKNLMYSQLIPVHFQYKR